MKKILTIMLCLCMAAALLGAQSTQRQKMLHMAAVRIAEQIGVREDAKAQFITLYQSYKKETAAVNAAAVEQPSDPEEAAEAKILGDFDKSAKILSLRRSYYTRFRTILSPSQIQKMYDIERAWVAENAARKGR